MASRRSQPNSLITVAIISAVAGFSGGWLGSNVQDIERVDSRDSSVQQQFISSESELISSVAEEVSPSVVSINLVSQQTSFFGAFNSASAGTGIILSSDGVVITNRHVIPENSEDIEITLSDGTVYDDIEIIGRDPRGGVDIAFLKINGAKDLRPASIGESDAMKVGDRVIAIGNALGEFQNSVTTGIISGRSRPIVAGDSSGAEALTNLLQTDAAINPGNSGGPLVNINGEVIGINTAVAEGENIGFAIPISDVSGSIKTVIDTGEFQVPYIGVRYETIDADYAYEYNLDVESGAYLRSRAGLSAVLEGSPADKAGLQDKDIIVAVDGTEIDEANGLSTLIGRKKVGDSVELRIIRGDENLSINVTLEAAPETL